MTLATSRVAATPAFRSHVLGVAAFAVAVAAAWAVIIVYVVHASLPFNPVHLPGEGWIQARIWLPQGWAFFTRDPREDKLSFFTRQADGWWQRQPGATHGAASNLFGLRRRSRAQGIEGGVLYAHLVKAAWHECSGEPAACLEAAPVWAEDVPNPSPGPTLCGQVGFVRQPLVPWAWSRSARRVVMPSHVARMSVRCD